MPDNSTNLAALLVTHRDIDCVIQNRPDQFPICCIAGNPLERLWLGQCTG